MKIVWEKAAWEDYLSWQDKDKKILRRINELLRDIQRNPFAGIGKPEPLKNKLCGNWSRRIDECHRFVYQVKDDLIIVVQCRYHY
ncbi:MAG: toxin YoeB [Gammaproteobacteria bacterium GWE2_37_16]|nr:MAG: toxin YoeB [Gammaproteobacteria bacterium GWE2_37_16]